MTKEPADNIKKYLRSLIKKETNKITYLFLTKRFNEVVGVIIK